jgi:hypothetical protein
MTDKSNPGATPIGSSSRGETLREKINSDLADRLTHLLHLANDLCLAYRTAIRRIDDVKLREELEEMDQSHDRLRAQLGELIQDLGHSPVESGDLHGLVERGRVVVGGWQGDEGILRAMADNERELLSALREERHHPGLPAELVKIIEEAIQNEQSHAEYYNRALGIFVG